MTNRTSDDLRIGDRVKYIPNHAFGDASHPDCEVGIVCSITCSAVFVQYQTGGPKATNAKDLILLGL